jgi:hypothetical protein
VKNYALTISQIVRDTDAVLVQWGLPRDIGTTYSAVYKRYDRRAYVGAWLIKRGNYHELAKLLSRAATPIFLRSIADALDAINDTEGKKAHFQLPTPTCNNIVASWRAAVDKLHNETFGEGENNEGLLLPGETDPTIPTHAQVRDEFRRRFGQQKLPTDYAIRKLLHSLGLPYGAGKRGRPQKFATK